MKWADWLSFSSIRSRYRLRCLLQNDCEVRNGCENSPIDITSNTIVSSDSHRQTESCSLSCLLRRNVVLELVESRGSVHDHFWLMIVFGIVFLLIVWIVSTMIGKDVLARVESTQWERRNMLDSVDIFKTELKDRTSEEQFSERAKGKLTDQNLLLSNL